MEKNIISSYIVFTLDKQPYGLSLSHVSRIFRAVEIIPVPHFPNEVQGIVNVLGQLIPVLNLRLLLGLTPRSLKLSDQFLQIQIFDSPWLLVIDHVVQVLTHDTPDILLTDQKTDRKNLIESFMKFNNDLIFILNIENSLTPAVLKTIQDINRVGSEFI